MDAVVTKTQAEEELDACYARYRTAFNLHQGATPGAQHRETLEGWVLAWEALKKAQAKVRVERYA